MTAPMNSPAMSPEQQGRGGEQDDAQLGLVNAEGNHEGQQVLGTCSPEPRIPIYLYDALIARLEAIRKRVHTAPEERAVTDCIAAARELLEVSE